MRGLPLALALGLVGCASQDAAGTGDAGPNGCSLQILGPGSIEVGTGASYSVEFDTGDLSGARVATWTATVGGAPVTLLEVDDGVFAVELTPQQPGVHTLTVSGTVGGGSCTGASRSINAIASTANWQTFRLWVEPPAAPPAPQELSISVPGLSDYALGDLSLQPGTEVQGSLFSGASTFGAFLRATRIDVARGAPREGFAVAGVYEMWMESGSYSLLIIPDDAQVAPRKIVGSALDLGGDQDLSGSVQIGGLVSAPDGSPLEGATVGLELNGVPSQTAITGADGRYQLSARPGAELSVAVTPPAGSGLPFLEAHEVVASVDGGSEVDIAYDSGIQLTTASITLRDAGGAAAAGASALWVSEELADAGAVSIDGGASESMLGRVRIGVTAAGDGTLSQPLTRATYQVLVSPVGDVPGLVEVVVDASPPSMLTTPAPATLSGTLMGPSGPVEAAKVEAAVTGPFAAAAGGATQTTGAGGTFSLPLSGGLPAVLRVVPPPEVAIADLRSELMIPGGGADMALGEVEVPSAIRVSGRLTVPGFGDLAGARVTLRCGECGSDVAIAAAVTDAAGRFVLRVPDPGEVE